MYGECENFHMIPSAHSGAILDLHFSHEDGSYIYTASTDKTVGIFDTASGSRYLFLALGSRAFELSFVSPFQHQEVEGTYQFRQFMSPSPTWWTPDCFWVWRLFHQGVGSEKTWIHLQHEQHVSGHISNLQRHRWSSYFGRHRQPSENLGPSQAHCPSPSSSRAYRHNHFYCTFPGWVVRSHQFNG